jgi:protein gp37
MLELRAPELLAIKAPLHFLSYEPALGPIDMFKGNASQQRVDSRGTDHSLHKASRTAPQLDHAIHWDFRWVLAGGGSGPKARPANPRWFRSLRDQCAAARGQHAARP